MWLRAKSNFKKKAVLIQYQDGFSNVLGKLKQLPLLQAQQQEFPHWHYLQIV